MTFLAFVFVLISLVFCYIITEDITSCIRKGCKSCFVRKSSGQDTGAFSVYAFMSSGGCLCSNVCVIVMQ